MAYDFAKGTCCGRDWSIGAGEAESMKAEVWTVPQISALGDVVEREVNHNLALCRKRLKAGSLDKAEGEEFAKFARGWREWKAREMGEGRKLTGLTVDKLKQWRSDNAQWTSKLSETARGSLVVMRSVAVILAKPKPGGLLKLVAGGVGAFGLGWLVGKRS
jgi:hypothetical protein